MPNPNAVLRFISLIALGCTAACGGNDGQGSDAAAISNPASVADFCSTSCAKEHACDSRVDIQTCTNSCKNELASGSSKVRADYLSRIGECYAAEDCATVLAGSAVDACVKETIAVLSPTEAGTEFCTAFEATSEKCAVTFDKAACYDSAKIVNDSTLGQAQQCLSKSCADVDACVSVTLL